MHREDRVETWDSRERFVVNVLFLFLIVYRSSQDN